MSRPVKNARTRTTPAKVGTGSKTATVGKPKMMTGRENTNAGGYAAGGESKSLVNGPSQIFKDNRG